jgi:hypothetical protein
MPLTTNIRACRADVFCRAPPEAVLALYGVIEGLIASRARCDGPYGHGVWLFWAASGGTDGEHPLHIPGHSHEAPLAAHLVEPAERELTESERRFDDAEHRFRSLFAQGVRWHLMRVCFNLGANQAATAESSGRGGVQFRRGHTWPV